MIGLTVSLGLSCALSMSGVVGLQMQVDTDATAIGEASFWLPEQMSHHADPVDWVFWFIMWVSIISFVGIVVVMVYFCYKYPRDPNDHEPEVRGPTHNTQLEVIWTAIPLAIVIYMFWVGLEQYIVMATPPPDAYTIDVKAQKWSWEFQYPNGMLSKNLHVPKGEAVRLRMRSVDVLHAFYAPVLRVKMDIIPGRTSQVWFIATESTGPAGAYKEDDHNPRAIFCAEYCGTQHSMMWSEVYIHETREDFEEWMDTYGPEDEWTNEEKGKWYYENKGCKSCHNIEGNQLTGPNWAETAKLFAEGGSRALKGGRSLKVDEDYLRNSILLPRQDIVEGYPATMPATRFRQTDAVDRIIDYIKSLHKP